MTPLLYLLAYQEAAGIYHSWSIVDNRLELDAFWVGDEIVQQVLANHDAIIQALVPRIPGHIWTTRDGYYQSQCGLRIQPGGVPHPTWKSFDQALEQEEIARPVFGRK